MKTARRWCGMCGHYTDHYYKEYKYWRCLSCERRKIDWGKVGNSIKNIFKKLVRSKNN